jgi:hypothetical protein
MTSLFLPSFEKATPQDCMSFFSSFVFWLVQKDNYMLAIFSGPRQGQKFSSSQLSILILTSSLCISKTPESETMRWLLFSSQIRLRATNVCRLAPAAFENAASDRI